MTKVIAINAGSSSLKFQLFDMSCERTISKGVIERIGLSDSVFTLYVKEERIQETSHIADHDGAVALLLDSLIKQGVIRSYDEIDGVGHRVVHGGEIFSDSVLITEEVMKKIEELSSLAPLHNPANLTGIRAFQRMLGAVPAVAVFDTAFHQTMPESSYLYSLPYEYYEDYRIRKYGFHGTSHKYVMERAGEMLGRPVNQLRLISCHLGNGASITAIQEGKSIDTSMGFTPLAGVTMGTRSGDVDPALLPYIIEQTGDSIEAIIDILNKKSGLLGISGFSSDLRDIELEAFQGNKRAQIAMDVFVDRIRQYIGAYVAKMSGVDAIIFTAGIGENSSHMRSRILEGLECMGVHSNPMENDILGHERFISYSHSPVKVMVIPTNEELVIARDVMNIVERQLSRVGLNQ